jgi:phosphatidylglycerophosphate synthase
VLMLLAAASFAALVWNGRHAWSPQGRFGEANALSIVRLVIVLALPSLAALGPHAVLVTAITIAALDGVDGWLARRLKLASEFGEYLDKETDAFFMLVLCLLLYGSGRLGAWILLPGLLRYGFVTCLKFSRPRAMKERRSVRGRVIYFGMISALIFAFTPFTELYEPYAAVMTLALAYSFAEALLDLYRAPAQERG